MYGRGIGLLPIGTQERSDRHEYCSVFNMVKLLNSLIVLLLLAWVLGMIFSAVFGLLIHLLLVLAVIVLGIRLYLWAGQKKRSRTNAVSTDRNVS